MRDFIKYLCSLLILLHFESFAQQPSPGEKIVFSSPQAAQLGKFGGHTINYSTGTPNINVPLLTLAEGDFKLPISVQYSYNGFRPSDQPAWVGVGFSLLAGGTVSRTIKGFADELSGFGYLSHASSIANFVNLSTPTYSSFTTNIQNINDTHADLFSFQFNGYSGKLVLDGTGAARVVSDAPIKVEYVKGTEPVHSSNQVILKWIFTVEDGTKYTFSNMEFTGGGGPANEYLPSAWHLSEVLNVKGDRITFEYTEAVPLSTARRIQYGRSDVIYNVATTNGTESSSETVVSQNRTEEIFLTKIKGSTWELTFDSDAYTRFTGTLDGPINARKLNTIKLYNTTVTPSVKTNQFSFEYSEDNGARLHLQKITRDGDNPYLMSYYSLAPSFIKGTDANVDYWGYYNGITNTNLIPQSGADLEPRLTPTLSGALFQLTYPTKGSTTIEYEQNSYSYVQNTATSSSRIEVTDYYHRRYWSTATNSLAQDGFSTIVLTAPTRVDVRLNNASVAPAPVNCTSQGTYISLTMNAGTYTPAQILSMFNFYPCNHPDAAMPGFDITLNIKVFRPVTSNMASYGGVRVKTLTDHPGLPSDAPLAINNFTYPDSLNPLLSSGVIAKEPYYQLTFSNTIGVHNMYRSTPFNPEALSPLYYRNVVSTTSQYQTTHSFTSHKEETDSKGKWAFAFDSGTGGVTHAAALFSETSFLEMGDFGNYDFMRSLPKEIIVRDLSGNLKKRTSYRYQGYHNPTFQIPAVHYEVMGRYNYEPTTFDPIDQRTVYYGKAYYIVGGWPRKTSETVTDYGSNGADAVSITTNYLYANSTHLQPTQQRVTQSDGTIEETNFKYPLDYGASANTVIQGMIAANMVTYPVEQVTWLEKSPSDRKVIDANVTTYNTFTGTPSNHILPYKKFRFNGLNGSIGTFANYDGSSNESASASYRETVKFTHYDTQGNPLSLLINGGEKISYLWSYKGQYPVAEIQNADNAEVVSALGGTTFTQMADMTDSPTIKAKLDAVRTALSGSLVTAYQYKPTEGISAISDPAGKNLVYEYDTFGRLTYIKDNTGKIRSSFCYNYAGQNIACGSTTPTGIVQPAAVSLLADAATCGYGVTATATDSLPTMGKSIVLTAACAGTDCSGVTYTWTGLGVSGTGASKTLFAPGSTGNFQYIVTANKGGCSIKRDTITLAVKAGGTYVVANGCYTLNVYNSRLQNESDALGARIRVYDPTSNNNQIFQLTGVDGDSYKILSASANKVWEPSTPILDWSGTYLQDWTGTSAQKWYLSPSSVANEYYFASKANPSLVMELGGGVSTAGNYTVLWPLWGAAHQRYRLDPVTCPVIGPDCDFTVTVPAGSNNLSPTMGQQITLTPTCAGTGCTGVTYTWTGINVSGTGASKTFRAPGSTGSFQYTITVSKSGCTSKTVTVTLTVQAGGSYVVANGCYTFNVFSSRLQNESDAIGARIRVYSPTTNSNQIFQLTGVDGDSYKILSVSANKVWEPSSPILDWSGTYLQNWTGTTAQKWYLSPTSVSNTYNFASKANPSLIMELGGGVSTDGNYTVLWPLWGGGHQSYRLDPVGCPTARMGLEEIFTPPAAQAQVLIYPNPVKDRLHLEINDSVSLKNLQLFNVKGTLVFETASLPEDGIDVSALPDGAYLIKMVFTNGSAASYRIVKQ